MNALTQQYFGKKWLAQEASVLMLVLTFLLQVTFPVKATAPDSLIKVAYAEIWPLAYTEDGEAKGMLNDIVRSALAAYGKRPAFKLFPIKRMFRLVASGEAHVSVAVRFSGPGADAVLISDLPLASLQLQLFSLPNNPEAPATSVADLADLNIITVTGFTYAGLREKLEKSGRNIHFINASTRRDAVAMLIAKRAKYILDYRRPMARIMPVAKITKLDAFTIHEIPLYFIVSRKAPHPEALMKALEDGVKRRNAPRPSQTQTTQPS
ncbi:MAG: transporter substrate-binding domain-containing protein [Kordiimonadaceae bacterium]|nr:transporter substrate-binding domain-containing protein [Kordiimonadaceae bacterium]